MLPYTLDIFAHKMIPRPIVCVSGGSFTSDALLDKYFLVAYD